jgi:protease-4
MKKTHIVIVITVAVAIIIGLTIGFGMRGFATRGNVGVVEVEGVIVTSKYTVRDLKMFADDPSIKAVILRVDSPGGVVAASQEIYDEVAKIVESKKVVVSMASVAASGAYYISLPADVICANPGTITGSISVIMDYPVFEKLLNKIGIDFEVIKSREHKDVGAPYRHLTEEEKELMQDVIMDVYNNFVDATARDRNLPRDSVLKFADGRILTGRQAKDIGLIDTLASFEQAVDITGDLVGIEEPFLVYPPKRMSLIDLFIEPAERLLMPRLQFLWH